MPMPPRPIGSSTVNRPICVAAVRSPCDGHPPCDASPGEPPPRLTSLRSPSTSVLPGSERVWSPPRGPASSPTSPVSKSRTSGSAIGPICVSVPPHATLPQCPHGRAAVALPDQRATRAPPDHPPESASPRRRAARSATKRPGSSVGRPRRGRRWPRSRHRVADPALVAAPSGASCEITCECEQKFVSVVENPKSPAWRRPPVA